MLHLFKSAASRAITFGLIGLLVAGLLTGAVRLALPFADLFRSELEAVLSDTLGLEVRVGGLGLHLAGLDPRIVLQDVELLDPSSGRPRLSLEQLRIGLNLAASLRELAPNIESLTLVGAELVIKRSEDGQVIVAGLEALEANDPQAMTFFLGNGSFGLADSDLYWIDQQSGAPALHLSDVQAHFENRGELHRIGVLARLHGDPQTRVRLVGDMRGEPGNPADWSGEIYVHLRGGCLDRILDGRLPAGLRLGSDLVEVESWNRVQGKVVTESLNLVAAKGLSLSKSGEEAKLPLQLDELGGLVRWRLADSGWRLEIKDLALTLGGARRPDSDLEIRFAAGDDGGWAIAGGNGFLDLTVARNLLAWLPPLFPEEFDTLGEIRPGGVLHDLRFRFAHRPELPPLWAASGRIEDLSLDAHGPFPGFAGLAAEVVADERAGQLVLSSSDLALDLPRLLPDPIRLDEATGEIRWRRDAGGALRVGAREIVAGNADILTRSRFSIAIPADGAADGGSPFLDLYTEFKDAEVASVRDYIPSKKLKKKLADWLGRAFISGTVPSGALLFRGALADFPFDEQQGRFEVLFGVQDTTLDFHPDWPRLEGLVGEVRFENREMEIFVSEGRFLDSELVNVSARIPDLKNAVAVEIRGRAEGPFADGLRVLGETPLREKLGAVARALEAEGVSRLDLDMAIPLRLKGRKVPLRLAGELTWPGPAALAVADQDIRLTDLAGTLRFTERTLVAKAIKARLWDVPVRLRVDTREPRGGTGGSTRIRVAGRFRTAVLAQRFPSPAWEPVEGGARLELRLDIGTADMSESVPPIDFELTSDLAGLALDLPAPVGKPTAATRRLHLSGRLAPEGALLRIQGGYGDLGINLGLDRRSGGAPRLTRGSFNLGGGPIPLPKGEGLTLGGSVATLDLPAWIEWGANRGPSAVGNPGGSARLRSVALHAQRMLLVGVVLNDVRLDLDRRGDRWDAKIEATELEGTVAIPHRPRRKPLRIALARLDLKAILGQEGEEPQAPAARGHTDPRQVHTLDLSVERLLWGETPLGQVTLRSQAAADGLDFTDLVLAGPFMSLQGQGSWKQTDAGPHSHLSLTARGSDLGEFLRGIELESLIQGAPAEVALDLDWPGGPDQFSAAELKGRVRFDVEAGSLLEVEPGVGRVLGILNLDALQRRLTLDFSDLFDRGYAFEKISGQLEIQQGTATIEELVIQGPSADIAIAGSTNLVDRQFKQTVTVTPRIGTGVAIASAVAGGPLVGAAVFLADRVSGGVVDKLGRHQYVISGPWATPEIRRVGWGAGAEQEAAQGQFIEDWGRAGASGTRESKPGKVQTDTPTEPESAESAAPPPSSQGGGDENLFLEGY